MTLRSFLGMLVATLGWGLLSPVMAAAPEQTPPGEAPAASEAGAAPAEVMAAAPEQTPPGVAPSASEAGAAPTGAAPSGTSSQGTLGTKAGEPPMLQTVVTGTRSERLADEVPVPTEVITRRDILRSGARDLSEVLSTHPGIDFQRTYRGAALRLQGLDAKNVAILVDGQRVSGAVGNVLDLSRFTLRDVERVEVVKGPGAALYGSEAMGGVVNIITRKYTRPLEAGGSATYGMGNELDLRGSAGGRLGAWDVRLGAGRRSADPWDRDPRDAATTGNQTSGFDVSGQVGLTSVDGRSGVRLSSDYQWRDAFGIDSLPTGAVFDRRERNEWFNTTLAGRWAPSEVLGFDLQLRHSLFRSQFQQDQRAALDEDRYEPALERMWMATATSDLALGERHQLTAGVEPTLYLNSAPRLEGGRGQRVRTGLFLQDAWAVLEDPKLTLLGGVRLDLDSQFGSQPSPRFSALWEALPEVTVRGSHGWGFRAPSFTELLLRFANPGVGYVVEGNPDLKPERSHGATVSADWKVGPRLQVGASLFRTELQDLIAVTTLAEATPDSPLRYGYDNIARALTQGGELTGRINTWTSTWLDLGYALTDARDRDSGELLEGRAVHRLTAQLSGQWREAGLEWMVRTAWSSGRRFTPDLDGDGTLDPVWTAPLTEISARVGWRPWQRVQLFAGVNNLLDQGDALYLPIPPLQLYGGASVEL